MTITRKIAASLFALTCSWTLSAHHSFADYDASNKRTVTGTITEVRWGNPHLGLAIVVTGAAGAANTIQFSGPAVNDWRSAGWVKSDFVIGDKVTITGFPKRDDPNHMSINVLVNGAGKSFGQEVK